MFKGSSLNMIIYISTNQVYLKFVWTFATSVKGMDHDTCPFQYKGRVELLAVIIRWNRYTCSSTIRD